MKKFLLALALMSMTLAFTGCGEETPAVDEDASVTDDVVTPEVPEGEVPAIPAE